MQKKPLIHIGMAARSLNLSIPTVSSALKRLAELGIAGETTGKERDRIFAYTRYLEIVSAGTEPMQG
jgi:DNA-binding transcriptional regulator GbsR (MarR family)